MIGPELSLNDIDQVLSTSYISSLQLIPPQNPAGQGHVLNKHLVWVQLGHLPQSLTDGAAISFEFC